MGDDRKKSGRLKGFGRVMKRVGLAVGGAATGGVLPDVVHILGEAAAPAAMEAVVEASGVADDPMEAWAMRIGAAIAGAVYAWIRVKKAERLAAARAQ